MFKDNYLETVRLLIQILAYLDWDGAFALKGGTAINLFYQDMPRLSVDIDLTYLPVTSRAEATKDVRELLSRHQAQFTKHGLSALHSGVGADNPFGKLVVSNQQASIVIEPNPVNRGSVIGSEIKSLTLSAIERFEMEVTVRCLSEYELYASKLIAMLDRQHPRDIFDMMMFYDKYQSLELIIDLAVVYLIQSNRPFHELLQPHLRDISEDFRLAFQGMVHQPLALEQLISYRTTIFDAMHRALQTKHMQLLESLLQDSPQWGLSPYSNISNLPGVKWRLQNIAKMSDQRRKLEIDKLENIFLNSTAFSPRTFTGHYLRSNKSSRYLS